MRILIIDTETTDVADKEICEVAATLYNITSEPRECGSICSVSFLLPVETNNAESVNGITPELTKFSESYGVNLLNEMVIGSDYLVAFNAEFDAPIVNSFLSINPVWICAMKDIDWSYPAPANGSFKLIDLALWMGIGVSFAHRAGDDVRLLVECFNRRKESLPEMIDDAVKIATSPMVEIQALVDFADKDLAKNAGFIFDYNNRRIWTKKIRECHLYSFCQTLDFPAVKLK